MKKVELHAKTKYSFDNESTMDIEYYYGMLRKMVRQGKKYSMVLKA